MAPSSSSATTSVQVALRIRPPTTQDTNSIPARFQRSVIHATSSTSVTVEPSSSTPSSGGSAAGAAVANTGAGAKKQLFSFDQVHPPPTTQYALFTSTAEPLISRFVDGFNCTILAYGQTSSGKTFTMTGIDLDADPSDPNNGMGIIPRAVSGIFSRARQLKEERGGSWDYNIKGSFIEIYNEDLIDLLSIDDTVGGRREVQIREDKDGHIIWGGLREVNVRNSSEVMTLLRKGTSIRRTNETDMNAQSSRSHAIFSLTLIQKKYTGALKVPVRSSSPLPPGGRSPSRLARPSSVYSPNGRASSPTLGGRPSTPSFAAAMGRGGLRPSSALGHTSEKSTGGGGDDSGECITIVSKFHFVDLAGSERLKRTAAAGERIKEGISINSGLLALGNVISALGDPSRAKSHTATHVPYRDSKLTRLLQDSLGGNAHTLMIACVSPAEWNVGETVNTLKYANRARNIKNRAVVNEKEDGWDDVEWLQGTVSRLRRELKGLKEGGVVTIGAGDSAQVVMPEVIEGAGKKVLAQMTELQNNYEDLREKFVERTQELTRLRQELGERQRGSIGGGAVGGTAKYEEIVGPVIEEYEKTIAAMEAELNLNRAALRHTNEMVEEKEDELAAITERHAATELYVEELRSRVAKLTEREASTEAYVRDLEEKMKTYDESSITSSESMSDLKREVARYRDTESHSGKYIADLEARLARSDESVLGLQQTVEKLEQDCERRRAEAELLQSRLDTLRQDGENWRTDLEERERKVKELEQKMMEWEQKKKEAGDARIRLGSVAGEVAQARRSLEVGLSNAPKLNDIAMSGPPSGGSDSEEKETTTSKAGVSLENQLIALQQTHTATLADLSSVSAKYRDALREISDLAAQIQEAKLSNLNVAENPILESPTTERPVEIPPFRRRMPGPRSRESSEPQVNSAGRRLFFRQAASAESLHTRSLSQSQSLSQELSSARLRKASISSHGTSNSSHSPSNSHTGSISISNNSNPISLVNSRPNLSISLPSATYPSPGAVQLSASERSVTSLENEIMRLQEVLKEREAEISVLEESLKESQKEQTVVATPVDKSEDVAAPPPDMSNGHASGGIHLSPKTLGQFDHIRQSMENSHDMDGSERTVSEPDESLDRLNELMLSMAQKESQHRETVDDLEKQLTQVRRQFDDLTALSRDQALNMSTEIEALRNRHDDSLVELAKIQQHEAELVEALRAAEVEHAAAVEKLRAEYDGLLEAKEAEAESRVTRLKAEHEELLRQKEAEAAAALHKTDEEYYNALTKLRGDHAESLARQAAEAAATLERLREEHAGVLRIAEISQEGSLSESQSARNAALKELQDEHAAAITRKEASFVEERENLKAEQARSLTVKDEDYSLLLDKMKSEHDSILAKLKEEWRVESERLSAQFVTSKEEASAAAAATRKARDDMEVAIQALQEQQAAILHEVESGHEEQISQLKTAHHSALQEIVAQAEEQRSALIQSHTEESLRLKTEHQLAMAQIDSTLVALQERHRIDLEEARAQSARLIAQEREHLSVAVADLEKMHAEERKTLTKDHDLLIEERDRLNATVTELEKRHVSESSNLHQDHELLVEERDKLNATIAELEARHVSERSTLQGDLELLVEERDKLASSISMLEKERSEGRTSLTADQDLLAQERDRLTATIADLQQRHSDETSELRTSSDVLIQERDRLAASVAEIEQLHLDKTNELRSSADLLSQERDKLAANIAEMEQVHLDKTNELRADAELLSQEHDKLAASIAEMEQHHLDETNELRTSADLLAQERDKLAASIASLVRQHSEERDALIKIHEALVQELESYKVAAEEFTVVQEETRQAHETALNEKSSIISSMEQELSSVQTERDDFEAEVARLRGELDKTRGEQSKLIQEASKRESLVDELEKHRYELAEMQENLQRVKDEKDNLQAEKIRQDNIVRDLQAQIARSSSPPNARAIPDRNMSYTRATGLPAMKLPPPTPPPSVPPPPAPRAATNGNTDSGFSTSSQTSSIVMSSASSRESQLESPSTSVGPSLNGSAIIDPKVTVKIEQQAKLIDEQEAMIKTLNKQLTHCESDLQTHMDLVSTLETSLGDSEKNLRKARMHATELARERDTLNTKIEGLRNELTEAKREVVTVRRSIVEEKQSLEQRLDEERKAKERARAQLDTRMEELQKRKSKFACL